MGMLSKRVKKNTATLALNIIIILVIIAAFFYYGNINRSKLRDQNIQDISNVSMSAAKIAENFFTNQQQKLIDIAKYAAECGFTRQQLLKYLEQSNADDKVSYELVSSDFSVWLADGDDDADLAYSNKDYAELMRIFELAPDCIGQTGLTPEFTSLTTGATSFSIYTYLELVGDGNDFYTLMSISKSSDFTDSIALEAGYDRLSTVLIDSNGDYILSRAEFKSYNFFEYMYVYNELSLDEKNALKAEVLLNERGELEYLNSRGEECVYAYCRISGSNRYCIIGVPFSSFHMGSFEIRFTLFAVLLLIILMAVDFVWLADLNRQLRHSMDQERIANNAKTEFLSRMSHDIRTPLNGIIGMTSLSLDCECSPELQDNLKNIESSSRFLLGLVNDILDMSKIESGKMELHPTPYRYSEFTGYLNAIVKPLCDSKSIQFVLSENGSIPPVMVDRMRFNQIFFNLLSNAVKYTPSGGKVELICNNFVSNKVCHMDITVRDNGIGMSEEFQKKMFESFSQEERDDSRSQQGSGLGLSIVHSIVNLMNGTINVESAPGHGTCFRICLETPVATESDAEKTAEYDDASLAGHRILLCEDHPLNTQIAKKLLERKNIVVEHAENGKIGVEMFERSPDYFYDAVLMDIRMPIMDGLTACKTIRSMKRTDSAAIPIIAMTANAYDSDIESCLKAGMNAHISKPVDPNLLYSTLGKYLK